MVSCIYMYARFLFVTAYSQSVNTGKWTVMSLTIMPLVVCVLMEFVKMLSMRVAVFLALLDGVFIRGYSPSRYIVSTNMCVPMWLSCFTIQN